MSSWGKARSIREHGIQQLEPTRGHWGVYWVLHLVGAHAIYVGRDVASDRILNELHVA